ncbi:MAG: ferredoxin, partial [Desulfopila sp.]
GDTSDHNYAIALDIGTTTIYGQLVDLATGRIIEEKGLFNAQISYGEDIISRIVVAEKAGGLEKLQAVVLKNINEILEHIFKKSNVDKQDISTITIAG